MTTDNDINSENEIVEDEVIDIVDEDVIEETRDESSACEDEQATVREGFEEIAHKVSAKKTLSDDELDKVADVAIEILRSILGYFDAADAVIDEYDGDNGELIFNVVGDDLGILIGYHGKVLESFKCMFSVLLNRELGFRFPARVDVEGYDNRHMEKIKGLANSVARRAVQCDTEVRLRPMKPFERRIVHLTLRSNKLVKTHSEGVEPNRCVVITPVHTK
jgi:spoIIIJ-associated protein